MLMVVSEKNKVHVTYHLLLAVHFRPKEGAQGSYECMLQWLLYYSIKQIMILYEANWHDIQLALYQAETSSQQTGMIVQIYESNPW